MSGTGVRVGKAGASAAETVEAGVPIGFGLAAQLLSIDDRRMRNKEIWRMRRLYHESACLRTSHGRVL